MIPEHHDSITNPRVELEAPGEIGALPLLKTKLYRPPVTPNLKQRARLIERLERNRQRPLTLISAPAGYGKTMLASMWMESSDCSNAWLSLDKMDDDLPTFLSYLLVALQSVFPGITMKTHALLGAPTAPPAPVLARFLLNDLEQDGVTDLVGSDHIHNIVAAAVEIHLKKYPSDESVFQDLKNLLDQAKS